MLWANSRKKKKQKGRRDATAIAWHTRCVLTGPWTFGCPAAAAPLCLSGAGSPMPWSSMPSS
eukprot:5850450-Prymnesium_polylepis.1